MPELPLRARRASGEARPELRRSHRTRRGAGSPLTGRALRVAHLLPTLEVGGKERSVIDLCAASPALGVQPIVVTYDAAPPGAATLAPGDAPHVPLDRRSPHFGEALGRAIAAHGIDILHAHGHVAAVYAAPVRVAKLCTVHAALGSGWRWLPAILPALRRSHHLAAVSDDLTAATRRLTRRPVTTIPTGVDTARFLPGRERRTVRDAAGWPEPGDPPAPAPSAPDPAEAEELVVGIAARLHPVKRHRDLFAAMALLAAAGVRARLLVAGEGPLDRALRAAAPPNVEMLGPVGDMPAWYRRLDVFVLCSDREGMPLALLEAMASGLPCIATRVGGMTELIGDGRGVIGVPRRDAVAIAAGIAALAMDPARRLAIGRQARAAVLPRSIEAQASDYAAVYARLSRSR